MKIKAWIKAMRLRTLPLSVSGIIIGAGLAKFQLDYLELTEEKQFWPITILAILTTLSFQIVSNLANDLGDSEKGTDNKNRIGPTRAVQSGEISFASMKMAVRISAVIAMILALSLINQSAPNLTSQAKFVYFILAILCVAAAITYTVGKNAYGYKGLGDAMVFIFFGLVSVIGSYMLYGFEFENVMLFFAAAIGLWSTAVLNLNNLRDIENDRASKKNTLVVKMGFKNGKFYHALLILGGFLCWSMGVMYLMFLSWHLLLILALFPAFILLFHLHKLMYIVEPKDIDPEL
ncbi:MAG: 1,4-dihydroxy-2-naphthoate octaprenyltransferase, partial [Crocinitomicaceae bacterium]